MLAFPLYVDSPTKKGMWPIKVCSVVLLHNLTAVTALPIRISCKRENKRSIICAVQHG